MVRKKVSIIYVTCDNALPKIFSVFPEVELLSGLVCQ